MCRVLLLTFDDTFRAIRTRRTAHPTRHLNGAQSLASQHSPPDRGLNRIHSCSSLSVSFPFSVVFRLLSGGLLCMMSRVDTQSVHFASTDSSNESSPCTNKMRIHPNLSDEQLCQLNELLNQFSDSDDDDPERDRLPSSLNVKNVDLEVFAKGPITDEFERLFRSFDSQATFQYFRSFKMVRVYFSSGSLAAQARIQCHRRTIGSSIISCYFTQPVKKTNDTSEMDTEHLRPPKPQKQFLISPPSSPPVGWEPCEEATPVLDIELLNALSKLTPGQAHELHPPTEDQPAIVVHICEDPEQLAMSQDDSKVSELTDSFGAKVKIQQTKRPPVYERSTSEGSDESIDSF